jgi:DNA-binding SARP family transcriptional activator/tetratricopeptide (TPR) repeat protein
VAKLSIKLLGPFNAELDGQPLTDFRSDKVRALLAYLAVETQRPWTRDQLADLFWADYQETKAQANLRNALSNLRRLIVDVQVHSPFILITQSTLQFNPGSDYWLDVNAFFELADTYLPKTNTTPQNVDTTALEQALLLYQGPFMSGFTVDSPAFETWMIKIREHLHQKWVGVLRLLTTTYEKKGQSELALNFAETWIEQEPWDEAAYRHGMRILMTLERRSAALALFETCQNQLAKDLGIEPERETVRLFQRIKQGSFEGPSTPHQPSRTVQDMTSIDPGPLPGWLQDIANASFEPGLFVARHKEMAQLQTWLEKALGGMGSAAFITGEPGSGKTHLLTAFVSQAIIQNPDLMVLWGQCNAFTGQGDPFFPFMNMTRVLGGDVEPLLHGGIISLAHLQRVWRFLPESLTSLVHHGPDLIKRFLPLFNQFRLAGAHSDVSADLLAAVQALITKPTPARMSQPVLNDQFTQVLSRLSKDHPLILILDDLQWIDPGSTGLLFHLGRQTAAKPILILGAFRPEEVWSDSKVGSHDLVGVINELSVLFTDNMIDLAASEGRDFVNALLDSETNAFSPNFYEMLYQHTGGHPLFTIELLREMQLRKEIYKNPAGQWIEGENLNWNKLPPRVEAVIARRISMMPIECQELMPPACVQGEVFNVEALAQKIGKPENEVFDLLSQQVCKRHRLITPQGITNLGDQQLTQYRFRHMLFQIYLYNHLDIVEKTRLHGLVGVELEKRYGDHQTQFPEIAHTLARHFELAQVTDKAVHYYNQAGKNAMRLSAHQEAIQHFYRALELLPSLPPSAQRDKVELDLQLSLGPPLTALKGWGPPELESAYNRTLVLIEHSGDTSQLIPALWLLATFRIGRSEHAEVDRLAARLLRLAQQTRDPALLTLAYLQVSPFYQGKMRDACMLLECAAASKDINQQRFLAHRFGLAPAAMALTYLSNCLWLMGFPQQAERISIQAFEMAKTVGHPMTTCYVTSRACWMGVLKNDLEQVQKHANQLNQVATKFGFKNFVYAALFFMNWVKFMHHEESDQAIEAMNDVIEAYYATKTVLNRTAFLVYFAQACLASGQRERGLDRVIESITLGEKTGELWFQAEAWRTRGDLLLMRAEAGQAEKQDAQTCFETALQIAHEQGARAFELRAAISLAHFWQNQDRTAEALQVLDEVYSWFTEGFQTADLKEARYLIESLK